MIIRAHTVVTMNGTPIENGAVAISGNRIVDVGRFPEISRCHSDHEVMDLGEQALLPGLINAHCHLDYTCLRGKISPPKSFTTWIRAINDEKSKLSLDDYLASITEGLAEAKRFGTTCIANLTAFPELVRQIPTAPVRVWWFAELIDVRSPERANELVDFAVEALKDTPNQGLAPHALFTASKNLYQGCEKAGSDFLLTTHLAESSEEMEMFRDASGPLYAFMESIGRNMDDCGNKTPLELFVGATRTSGAPTGYAAPEWLVAHLNELTETDLQLLVQTTPKFHVVHSPRSHRYFGHSPFPFKRLTRLGFNVSLGTDSLASNENLNLFEEMRAFQRSEPGTSPRNILEMVTVNPALALNQQDSIGRISAGLRADLIAVPCQGGRNLFEEIVAFDREINWMMIDGKDVNHLATGEERSPA